MFHLSALIQNKKTEIKYGNFFLKTKAIKPITKQITSGKII